METENKLLIPSAIVIAGILIAMAIYFGGSRPASVGIPNLGNNTQTAGIVAPISDKDHYLGSKEADLVIVEYSDFECPFCKVFHSTLHQVLDNYKGRVALVYRQFPIIQLHSKAPKEAEASECATEQGGNTAFWKFVDDIFATTNSNDSLDPTELPRIAGRIGINVSAFNTCLSSGKYTNKIQQDVTAAAKAGAQGTPYSVIMNKSGKQVGSINGAQSYETVKAQLDTLLK